jgi:hypothetical protein
MLHSRYGTGVETPATLAMMRGLFTRTDAGFDRILFIESGERDTAEQILARLYTAPGIERVDVLTCLDTRPEQFDSARGTLYSVHAPEAVASRRAFVDRMARGPYSAIAIVCSGSGILEKWKWAIALRTRAKVVIADEHANLFPLDYEHRDELLTLLSTRITPDFGFLGELARLAGEFIVMPFTIAYLILFTIFVHLRRKLRVATGLRRRIG